MSAGNMNLLAVREERDDWVPTSVRGVRSIRMYWRVNPAEGRGRRYPTTDRRCDAAEKASTVSHLLSDMNARGYGMALQAGKLEAWRASVADADELGGLSTLFGVLGRGAGSREAHPLTGFARFRVRDARRYWRDSVGDEAALATLERYVVDARAGQIRTKVVTLTSIGFDEPTIVDGNKRSIAVYEARRVADFPLTVFLLVPSAN